MPISRKVFFRIPDPQDTTIYVRPGYNRVLSEEFEALKVKRVGLVKDKVEAHSQGDLRENFGFKAAKEAIRAVDRKMTALDRFVARNTFVEVDPAAWLTKPTDTLLLSDGRTVRLLGVTAPKFASVNTERVGARPLRAEQAKAELETLLQSHYRNEA